MHRTVDRRVRSRLGGDAIEIDDEQTRRLSAWLTLAEAAGGVGTWTLEVPTRRLVASDGFRERLGLGPGAPPTLDACLGLFDAEGRTAITTGLSACIERGVALDVEVRLIKGGRARVQGVRASSDASTLVHGVVSRVAAAPPSADEDRFRSIAETLPMIVWTARPDGAIDYCNRAFAEYTGTPGSEPFTSRWQRTLHTDDARAWTDAWTRHVHSGAAFEHEVRLRRHDGQPRWFRVQATAMRDESGAIVRWSGSALDIHELEAARAEARAWARRREVTLASITDAFFTVDPSLRFTHVNVAAERLLGHAASTLLGHELHGTFGEPAFDDALTEACRRSLDEQLATATELELARAGLWFEVETYPSEEELSVHLRDVTPRHLHRALLQQSEERFRLLAGATNDAVWDWDLDTDALWWSDGFATIFGLTRDELAPTIDAWMSRIHPEDQGRVASSLQAAVYSSPDPTGSETWISEHRFVRRDGSIAHVLDRGHVVRDAAGRAVRMVGGMIDVSDRRDVEERLREQATLLDNAQDAIVVLDLQHRILYWNRGAERMYGWTADEAVGRQAQELLYFDPSGFDSAAAQVLDRGEWVGELEQIDRHGKPLLVEAHCSVVRRGDDDRGAILSINTNITQRKKIEAQFLRAQRMESIGTLAGGLAHDLNNVLAPILMSVSAIREDTRDAELLEDLLSIEACAKRGAEMIRQLLAFARGGEQRRAPVDLGRVAADVQRLFAESFPKNIAFRLHLVPERWVVDADDTQMHQLLTNLFVNARDAMPSGGTLSVSIEHTELDDVYAGMHAEARPGPYVVVKVEDTGEGMSPEVLDRIFEPFFTTKDPSRGTGLGLSTAHAIVRDHGGFIHVYSELGRGTRFRIYLPAVPVVDAEAPQGSTAPLPRGGGEVVLVVDDDEQIRIVASRMLERFGYRVLLASNGAEAVATYALHRREIAVVLTDMAMPIMDGPTAIIALRAIDPDVRIIGSSGLGSGSHRSTAVHAGVQHFVPKPYTAESILTVIARVLGQPPAER